MAGWVLDMQPLFSQKPKEKNANITMEAEKK
jgi:hypothetical protein